MVVVSMLGKINPERGASRIAVSITILLLSVILLLIIPSCGGGGGGAPAPFIQFLPVGTSVTDFVVFQGFNYYAATVIPGELYKISITGLDDDADLFVFGTDSTFTFLATCSIDNTVFFDTFPEDCVIRASGSTLYFGVDGTFLLTSAGLYTIRVELLTITDRVLSMPFTDIIARTDAGVYSVPVGAGTYTISITGLTNDADLYVFGNDGSFTFQVTCPNTLKTGTMSEDCTLTSDIGNLYFIVDGLFSSTASVTYTALVTPSP
jgi:hypothetical protein